MCVLLASVYVHQACLVPTAVRFSGTGVMDGYEPTIQVLGKLNHLSNPNKFGW